MKTAIKPAKRLEALNEYYFSSKLREVAQLNAQGQNILSLAIGSPDFLPQSEVIHTLCEAAAEPKAHGYQPNMGRPELRSAFARWYQRWYNVDLDPDREILPLIGSKEGVMHVSMTFLNPGDAVLLPNPGYPTYRAVAQLAQAEIMEYELNEEKAWQPDFEALEKMDLSKVKLMWVNYPHMPTGAPALKSTLQQLVDFGRRHGIVICNDNPYSFILSETPMSILSIPGAKDCCLEMNSLSKSHNMPGWRIGMLAGKAEFISWVFRLKSNVDSGQFLPMQLAAARALECDAAWYAEQNRQYRSRRILIEELMCALHCTFDSSQQGIFLWGRIPNTYSDAAELCDKLLYQAGIFIAPGFIFGSQGNQYIRISLCSPEEQIREALRRVRQLGDQEKNKLEPRVQTSIL